MGIGDNKKTNQHRNQHEIKYMQTLRIRNKTRKFLDALPEGIGRLEVLGFFKSIFASITLFSSIPIVLADIAASKTRTISFVTILSEARII